MYIYICIHMNKYIYLYGSALIPNPGRRGGSLVRRVLAVRLLALSAGDRGGGGCGGEKALAGGLIQAPG